MTPVELKALSALMDRYGAVPERDVRNRAVLESLQRQGLASLSPAGWSAVYPAAAVAYVRAICAEDGIPDPWGDRRDATVPAPPTEPPP